MKPIANAGVDKIVNYVDRKFIHLNGRCVGTGILGYTWYEYGEQIAIGASPAVITLDVGVHNILFAVNSTDGVGYDFIKITVLPEVINLFNYLPDKFQ
jgi:hypothetical protein